jgi:hypothetical protein
MKRPTRTCAVIIAIAILCLIQGCSYDPVFTVSNASITEKLPAVATNTKSGEFLVAYLEEYSDLSGTHMELRVRRFDSSAKSVGNAIQPLGSGTHVALGRPAIAYNSATDQFFVAVPERVTQGGQTWDRVIGRHLDGTGQPLPGPDFLFDDKNNTFYDGPSGAGGHNSLHVAANTLLKEFLVTVQLTVNGKNGVWAQTVQSNLGPYGTAVQLADYGINGFSSHAVCYAPVSGTSPTGGRYLFTVKGTAELLDSKLKSILVTATDKNKPTVATSSGILLNFGKPEGNYDQFDIAYGEVGGKKRFLMVYCDEDNLPPGQPSSKYTWTGVWATFIDPECLLYTDFTPGPRINTPFPLTYVLEHVSNKYLYRPRVTYSASAKAFFAVWRELPTTNSQNTIKLSHIRGVWVDTFVDDGLYDTSLVPNPKTNRVISTATAGGQQLFPNVVCSLEDPGFADVAPLTTANFVAVWQQNNTANSKDLNVVGSTMNIP